MQSEAITALIEAMVLGGGSRAETFFLSHGLGPAYSSLGKYNGIQKRVNAALLQAGREGRQDEVLQAGLIEYGLDEAVSTGSEKRVTPGRASSRKSISPTSRVFISHASADADLADAVADLLRLGTGLSEQRILCTSLEGMGIPEGTSNYLEFLRNEISDAGLVLPLLTPAFFDSEVCLIEIGAMWGLGKETFPLIVPPVTYARVEKLLGKLQSAQINKEEGLSRLHDRIVDVFDLKAKTDMWIKKKSQFEKKLPDLLEGLAEGTRVDAADLKAAKKQVAKHKARVRALETKMSDLEQRLDDVTAARTQELFKKATRPRGNQVQRFEQCAQEAKAATHQFSPGVREALYEHLGRGEPFRPGVYIGHDEDAEAAVRDDLLHFNEEDGGYYLNTDDPDIEETITALEDLFEADWDDQLQAWFKSTYRKRLAVEVRPVWKTLGLL